MSPGRGNLHVGVVGHRSLGGEAAGIFVYTQCYAILAALRAEGGSMVAISATAVGSDTIFAEAALALGIPLELVNPFRGYDRDFHGPESRARYARLKHVATSEVDLRFRERDPRAYRRAMQWIVIRSDLVIAVWDGARRGSEGGTWPAVELAHELDAPLVHLDVSSRVTRFRASGSHGGAYRAASPRQIAIAIRARGADDV